jgi:hypothetical protein
MYLDRDTSPASELPCGRPRPRTLAAIVDDGRDRLSTCEEVEQRLRRNLDQPPEPEDRCRPLVVVNKPIGHSFELPREMAEATGLVDGVSAALIDTYRGVPCTPRDECSPMWRWRSPGADAVSGIAVLGDREELFGAVASMPTAWRVLIDPSRPEPTAYRLSEAMGWHLTQTPEGLRRDEARRQRDHQH